jgi:hypothetical protein
MKKMNVTRVILSVALCTMFIGVSANAEGMKCGAGKCGSSMAQPTQPVEVAKDDKKVDANVTTKSGKCGGQMQSTSKCGATK